MKRGGRVGSRPGRTATVRAMAAVAGVVALAWLAAGPGHAQVVPIPIEEARLANGFRIVVSTDRSTPIVAVNLRYGVGSGHEAPGRTGFAHLFEHLVFQGTENLADGELERMVTDAGGVLNGRTNTDRTEYTELVPAHHLDRIIWSHAERMRRLVVTEEGFARQREVVKEERRLRVDNTPYGEARITIDTLAQDYPPYDHSVVGSMEDLNAASVSDVRAFHDRWYRPANATLVVVGDTSLEEVLPMVERWFGGFDAGPEPDPLPPPPTGPRQDGERRADLDDPRAQLPLTYVAFAMPPAGHPDLPALRVVNRILASGQNSRLYRRLVADRGVATQVFGQVEARFGSGLFLIGALSGPGVEQASTEAAIHAEVGRLVADGPSRAEVEGVVNQLRAAGAMELSTVAGRARAIQEAIAVRGDPSSVAVEAASLASVTAADAHRVARRWLVTANRAVVVARPTEAGR